MPTRTRNVALALLLAAALIAILAARQHARSRPLPASATVYVTATGRRYHRAWCRSLRYSRIPVTKARAAAAYPPCRVCRP